jgi:hypothetical protein
MAEYAWLYQSTNDRGAPMPITPNIHHLFGHFQNLNLLALLADLRSRRMAWQAWSSSGNLCPVAHGLPAGQHVRELNILGQIADIERGCDYAARHLGADPAAVYRFVRAWDDQSIGPDWLLRQLEEMWQERLTDAVAMQDVLQGKGVLKSLFDVADPRGAFEELLV